MGQPDHGDCPAIVRSIQAFHMDTRGWNDIAYNGVVCPHGDVFEGRGPGLRSGANGDSNVNGTHYALCYLGGEGDPFTDEGKRGFEDGYRWLFGTDDLAAYEWVGHRDLTATACPGDDIYAWAHGPHGTEEDDFMAFSDEERAEILKAAREVNQRIGSIDDNTKNLGSVVLHLLGAGNWEVGAQRLAQAVRLIEEMATKSGFNLQS